MEFKDKQTNAMHELITMSRNFYYLFWVRCDTLTDRWLVGWLSMVVSYARAYKSIPAEVMRPVPKRRHSEIRMSEGMPSKLTTITALALVEAPAKTVLDERTLTHLDTTSMRHAKFYLFLFFQRAQHK